MNRRRRCLRWSPLPLALLCTFRPPSWTHHHAACLASTLLASPPIRTQTLAPAVSRDIQDIVHHESSAAVDHRVVFSDRQSSGESRATSIETASCGGVPSWPEVSHLGWAGGTHSVSLRRRLMDYPMKNVIGEGNRTQGTLANLVAALVPHDFGTGYGSLVAALVPSLCGFAPLCASTG